MVHIVSDSPKVCKLNIRIITMAVAREPEWEVNANDVQSAFLQTSSINREVYVEPPKEAN